MSTIIRIKRASKVYVLHADEAAIRTEWGMLASPEELAKIIEIAVKQAAWIGEHAKEYIHETRKAELESYMEQVGYGCGPGFVYFAMRPDGVVKIGYSKADPEGRVAGLKLEMISYTRSSWAGEQALHWLFRDKCDGGEYFRITKEEVYRAARLLEAIK